MTAFDNIKVNNWPATSNNLEDFLVLELPLNDQAALTSSRREIVAGSKVLFPKRTLTNSGVSMVAGAAGASTTLNIAASEYSTTGSVTNPGNLFDGDTSTTVSSSDGSRIYWTPASNISVTKFEVYFDSQYGGYKIGVEVTGGSNQIITKSNPGNSPGWVEFTSIAGDTIGPSNQIKFRSYRSNDTDPGILGINAVRVNDKIVTTAAAGIPKKHYDNNAVFSGTARINTATSSNLAFGTGDFTVECWAYPEGNAAEEGIFQISTDTVGLATTATNVVSLQMLGGAYRSYANDGSRHWATNVTAGQWVHLALVRQSGTLRLYVNGVADSNTYSDPRNYTCRYINVGGYYNTNYLWTGSIQDLRVYNGVAKYTANFTPPGAILG